MTHDHYLTIEQRERLERAIRERSKVLRAEIDRAQSEPVSIGAIGLAIERAQTTDEPMQGLDNALEIATLEREIDELRELEAAQARLHTPDYGVCVDCGADVPFARLEVAPAALRCVACQSRREQAHGGALPPGL